MGQTVEHDFQHDNDDGINDPKDWNSVSKGQRRGYENNILPIQGEGTD